MPVTQQQQQQHHHHHLFSAINTFLHALQPSHHNSPNPNSSVVPPVSPTLSRHGSSELLDTYQAFESQVSQRLSSLLPAEDSPSVRLPFLKELMALLLATQTDLRTLAPAHQKQNRTMENFLERSVKVLDACRGIKEQILEMEILQGMLQLVILCLNSDKGEAENQVIRARKALAQLLLHLEVEREGETHPVHAHRSFRGRLRERLGGCNRESSPQRWRSWHTTSAFSHGNHGLSSSSSSSSSSWNSSNVPAHGNNTSGSGNHVPVFGNHASMPLSHGIHGAAGPVGHTSGITSLQTLHTLELNLVPPKLPPKDEEECFTAAIYALNVVSLFSLATITAAFPSFGKAHSTGLIHPPHTVVWASPFLHMQQRVDEELAKRRKKHGVNAGLWELEQIFSLSQRLYELIAPDDSSKLDMDNEEEVKKVMKQLCYYGEELERDMAALSTQINEFYNRVVAARMGVLDMLTEISE